MVMALGSAFIYTWGMYKIIKANQKRKGLLSYLPAEMEKAAPLPMR